ncbi:MAG: glycosyltransferase family 39 protein [Pseudomonadota bacterium]
MSFQLPASWRLPSSDRALIWLAIAVTAVLHLATAGRYDMMRNELYFLACGRHPAFGYADQPPLVPLIAAATQLFGPSVWLLRLPAVIAAVALIPLCAAFARLIGGNRTAAVIAAIAAASAPGLAGVTTLLTTATFEPIAWTGYAYLITRAVLREDRRALLWAGLIAGLSMQAKYGIVMWLAPLALGVLATPARRLLSWRETWAAALIAVAVAAPSLIWQAVNGWPFLAIIAHHTQGVITGGPVRFEIGQILALNLVLAPLWVAGIVAPFVSERLKPVRFLSIAFVGATAINLATGGKDYYLFAAYPSMFVVGAVVCAQLWRWVAGIWMAAATANFALVAPIIFPLLDPPHLFRLLEHSHLRPAPDEKAAIGAPLTQVFSDELGWRALAQQVAGVYRSLPPTEREYTAIFANNYGEAAAIDIHGRSLGLPPAISGDNQYFLWGPRGYDGSVIIVVNGDPERWRRLCRSIQVAGTFGVPLAMPYERDRPITICRGLQGGLANAWNGFKRYGA